MKKKRKEVCVGYVAALRHAEKHKQKVFRKLDAENQKLDQMELKLDEK